jgi:hypothetical protein
MRSLRFPAAAAAALLLSFSGVSAHHVVWLDFSMFNLSGWASVNGNSPPTTADETAVQNLVIAYMVEDYAPSTSTSRPCSRPAAGTAGSGSSPSPPPADCWGAPGRAAADRGTAPGSAPGTTASARPRSTPGPSP